MQFIRIVWELLGKWQRTFVAIAFAAFAYEGAKLLGPYLVKQIVDALPTLAGDAAARTDAIRTIATLIGAMVVIHFVQSGFDLALNRAILRMLFGVEYDVNCAASEQCFALSMGYHEHAQAGSTITRVDRGNDKLMELLHDTSWQAIPTLLQAAVTTAMLFAIDAHIGALFLVFIPPFLWVIIRERHLVQPHRMIRYQRYEDAFGAFGESVWNMLTIQSFGNERYRHTRFLQYRDDIVREGRSQYLIEGRCNLWKNGIVNVGGATLLAAAVWRCAGGHLSIGSVVLVFTLVEKAYISLFNAGHLASRIADAHEGVTRLHALLAERSAVRDIPGAAAPALDGRLEFRHVAFAYPSIGTPSPTNAAQDAPVLRDLSFVVTPGTTIAFAGPSGGGKSTIVKLAFRHFDVTGGRVLFDGRDVREFSRTPLRQQLGFVPQEGQLFNGTIAENIRFGKEDATDEEVRNAARLAGAEEFIAMLPAGYATIVGEQGVHLSGGQRQRICIARAVVRKPKILVFDEATSHLDVESERVIQESLERLRGTTTIILIAHRLSTIRHADCIHVVEAGRIVESGSHEALIAAGGRYARLAAIQNGTADENERSLPDGGAPDQTCAPPERAASYA